MDKILGIWRYGRSYTMTASDSTQYERKMTDKEVDLHDKIDHLINSDLDKAWNVFCKEVMEPDVDGYTRMNLAEDVRNKYPDWISIASCDDHLFSHSYLVLIRHGSDENYMGMTAVYIPQNGEDAMHFFLYPSHARSVINAILNVLPEEHHEMPTKEFFEYKNKTKPSAADFLDNKWKEKPWYTKMGFDPETYVIPEGDIPESWKQKNEESTLTNT
jgi:hypothetical protein